MSHSEIKNNGHEIQKHQQPWTFSTKISNFQWKITSYFSIIFQIFTMIKNDIAHKSGKKSGAYSKFLIKASFFNEVGGYQW